MVTPQTKTLAHRIGNMLKSFHVDCFWDYATEPGQVSGCVAHTFCPPPETHPDSSPETTVLELPLWTGYQSALAVP